MSMKMVEKEVNFPKNLLFIPICDKKICATRKKIKKFQKTIAFSVH